MHAVDVVIRADRMKSKVKLDRTTPGRRCRRRREMRAYENIGSDATDIIGDLHANYVIEAAAIALLWRDELN